MKWREPPFWSTHGPADMTIPRQWTPFHAQRSHIVHPVSTRDEHVCASLSKPVNLIEQYRGKSLVRQIHGNRCETNGNWLHAWTWVHQLKEPKIHIPVASSSVQKSKHQPSPGRCPASTAIFPHLQALHLHPSSCWIPFKLHGVQVQSDDRNM